MNLEIQIQSLIFSFVFGIFFALEFNLIYRYLFSIVSFIKIIINIVFVNINAIVYFYLLYIINGGIIHLYFIIMLVLGFVMGNKKTRKIRKYWLEIWRQLIFIFLFYSGIY